MTRRKPKPPAVYNRLKLIRMGRRWTQADLSRRTGVTIATISRWETQKVRTYDADVLASLARALRVEPGTLLAFPDDLVDE